MLVKRYHCDRTVLDAKPKLAVPSIFFGIIFLFLMVLAPKAHAAPCTNSYGSGASAPTGYGAAWNVHTAARELLVQGADCTTSSATMQVGSGNNAQYVYNKGYYWTGTKWQDYTLTGTSAGTGWLTGKGTGSIQLPQAMTYVVGYVCQKINGTWECGCRDATCSTSYWQLQVVKGPTPPSTIPGGGGSGGGTSGGSVAGPGLPEALIPFAQPSLQTLANSNKKVIAHWHQWAVSRTKAGPENDTYERDSRFRLRPLARPARSESDWQLADAKNDIQWAQRIGVDAFFVNIYYEDQNNPYAWPMYIKLLRAARELNTGFNIAPNLDCSNSTSNGTAAGNAIVKWLRDNGQLDNPNQFKVDGKFVLGSYLAQNCTPSFWQDLKNVLQSNGLDPMLMCLFLGGDYRNNYDAVCDAWSDWGRKDPESATGGNYRSRYSEVAGREPIVAAISHGDVRYKSERNAYEQRGSETLRVNWEEAISTGADWAQLVTWNDIGEHSQFYPNTAEQFAMYDLTGYYISWFKTGTRPSINKDALYYFHRKSKVPQGSMPAIRSGSWWDNIEVVAFLTAPATVEIVTSSGTTRRSVGAGVQVVTAPMPSSGTPRFRIVRNGATVVDVESAFQIGPMPSENDVVYRGGSSLRSAYGKSVSPSTVCSQNDPDACLQTPGEPVWRAQ